MKTYNFSITGLKRNKYPHMIGKTLINCRISDQAYKKFEKDFILSHLSVHDVDIYMMVKEISDNAYLT